MGLSRIFSARIDAHHCGLPAPARPSGGGVRPWGGHRHRPYGRHVRSRCARFVPIVVVLALVVAACSGGGGSKEQSRGDGAASLCPVDAVSSASTKPVEV